MIIVQGLMTCRCSSRGLAAFRRAQAGVHQMRSVLRMGCWLGGVVAATSAFTYLGAILAEPPAPTLDPVAPVVDASLRDASAGVPSGGWITVRGRNLVPVSAAWGESDFQGDRAPVSLAGVSISVNGQPAFVAALRKASEASVDSDEIDAVLPPLPEGSAELTVTTPNGVAGPVPIRVHLLQPSFFPHPAPDLRHVRAETPAGEESIGPVDLFGDTPLQRPVRPALPAETILLQANGCGPLDTPLAPGTRPRLRIPLASPVTVKFGDAGAPVRSAGAAPLTPGLCEIEVEVPLLPTGEYPLSGFIGEIPFASGRILSVREVEYPGFRHGALSRFRLTGAHHFVSCTSCHPRSRFWGTPQACEACHLDRYRAVTSPNHAEARFPLDCSLCHVTSRFKGSRGGHPASSPFPLTGKHAEASCRGCHGSGPYSPLNPSCVSCHQADYDATTKPAHASTGIGTQCSICHNPSGWTGARTDHAQTQFPLTGKHAQAPCTACHVSGAPKPLPQCVSCHQANYDNTANPNHRSAGYPTGCDACHTTEAFRPATIGHPLQRFPLTGRHASLSCLQCHQGGALNALNPACSACHLDRYQSAANPNHVAAGFPTTCETCHTTAGFSGATIQHLLYPLTGRHLQTSCAGCHSAGVYRGTARTCSACHLDRYNSTTSPAHASLGFPTECQLCHSTSQFAGAIFQHDRFFPLTGKHLSATCAQCHPGGRYQGTPRDCAGCHSAAYAATQSPNHTTQSFPTTCQNCHTPAGWRPASFSHTRYPLTGLHASTTCSKCHVGAIYLGTPTACSACHTPNYTAAVNPNHTALGYPTTCQMCHTPAGWRPSTFVHPPAPLTGAHASATCAQCHPAGTYQGTSTLCSSCHLADYNAALSPNHATLVFPLACTSCHSTTAWIPASFVHKFPIFSGKHNHKWSKCIDCHVQPSNFTVFSCFNCHPKAKMDDEHKRVSGYSYDSPRCYQCHPDGRKH